MERVGSMIKKCEGRRLFARVVFNGPTELTLGTTARRRLLNSDTKFGAIHDFNTTHTDQMSTSDAVDESGMNPQDLQDMAGIFSSEMMDGSIVHGLVVSCKVLVI